MKIAIDTRWIFKELSGIGQVTQELICELARCDRENTYALLFDDDALRDRTARVTAFDKAPNFEAVHAPPGVFSLRSQAALPRLLHRLKIDVYHSPNYMIPFLAFPRRRPGNIRCVVTIHDVIPLLFPDHAPRSKKARLLPVFRRLLRETAARADVITTVSEASRRDVMAQLAISEARADHVVAIYNGVGENFRPDRDASTTKQGLLYVGRFDPYKNVPVLIEAFARLRLANLPDLRLRIIGPQDSRYPEAANRARALGIFDAIDWSGYVTGDELARAYREANVLVLPSDYEGFGLPVLEAMASGTPVVCTRAGSLPEVAGDAAVLVESGNVEALASALGDVLANPDNATRLREAGLKQARKFTWARTAEQMLAAYRMAYESGA